MKNCILLFILLMVVGCRKSKNHDPNDYVHLTSQQVIDSLHPTYEKKYYVYEAPSGGHDTLFFHSDNSITEIVGHDTVIYRPAVVGYDSVLHTPPDPAGAYQRFLYVAYSSPIDTVYCKSTTGLIFDLLWQTLHSKRYGGKQNDTLGAIGDVRFKLVK